MMKNTILTFFISLLFFVSCKCQSNATTNNDMDNINSIFDKVEIEGVDTKQNMLYGYFFLDKERSKLEKLNNELINQSYRFVTLEKISGDSFTLHVEKIERHTRETLFNEEQKLRELANKFKIASFDGFDAGNADSTKPLTSNEDFKIFIKSKNGKDLFDLGIKLYDLEIDDKVKIVFQECINQKIKPDTSAFKLGNTLLRLNKPIEGMWQLEQATKYNPQYISAFFNLGAACYDNKQFHKSIDFYQKADHLKPNNDGIIYGIAASQYALGQFDKSLQNCKKALQLNNQNENATLLLQMLKTK